MPVGWSLLDAEEELLELEEALHELEEAHTPANWARENEVLAVFAYPEIE